MTLAEIAGTAFCSLLILFGLIGMYRAKQMKDNHDQMYRQESPEDYGC